MNRPVRVVVIDSGVHAAHPHVNGVGGGIGLSPDGAREADYVDRLGHGTAVTAVIREKAPAAEIFVARVFDRELASTGAALVAACAWAVEQGADIVNLSLGTRNEEHAELLAAAASALRAAGAVTVAAGLQDGIPWLPGTLSGVWSVTLDWALPRDECRVAISDEGAVAFEASGYPRPIPGVPPERNLKGLSFAVANVTGLLAALFDQAEDDDRTAVLRRAVARGWTGRAPG
jgi:subtilisin family serine protease